MTYKQIQSCYKNHFKSTIKSCWIADVKRQIGLEVRNAYNRKSDEILNKCPHKKIENISKIIKGQIKCK